MDLVYLHSLVKALSDVRAFIGTAVKKLLSRAREARSLVPLNTPEVRLARLLLAKVLQWH